MTASKFARVLEVLADGQWHTLEGIQQEACVDKKHLRYVIAFLKDYDFLVVNEEKKEVKLKDNFQKFLTKTSTA